MIGQLLLVASVQAVLTCNGNVNGCSTRFWLGLVVTEMQTSQRISFGGLASTQYARLTKASVKR